MIFVYRKWERLCRALHDRGLHSIPAHEVSKDSAPYFVLKHDVETKVARALKIAEIEHAYGHRGSYYVQAYLLKDAANVKMLQKMQDMGHEITYHHDVMDSTKGNLDAAIAEFEMNCALFETSGFSVITVCQHGNPVVERVGYTSNRDFFRRAQVQALYPQIADIMVDFPQKHSTAYTYISDAGRRFQLIFDPLNNDLVKSDDKNIPIEQIEGLLTYVAAGNTIISIHPHRWYKSGFVAVCKAAIFRVIKCVAKLLIKIPFMKRFMSRYYHLAKKI
ncbi:MAG: hypothetical protein IJC99_04340 [Clostridia bacterium]|nr:hypothetical protein [Clostridia bacterium]